MEKILFTEEYCQPENLFPFTQTRRMQDIRIGILTIREKWERLLQLPSFNKEEENVFSDNTAISLEEAVDDGPCFLIHAHLLPTRELIRMVKQLKNGECITDPGGQPLVYRVSKKDRTGAHLVKVSTARTYNGELRLVCFPWDIFQQNDWAIREDFKWMTARRTSAAIPRSNSIIKPKQVFLEKGARVTHCIINASTGPVYIGKNAEIMEGCIIRGPFAMGEGSLMKAGTRVYGATTLGPGCVVGGEVKNSVLFGYSNKAHDGYLGDSVIGEWCNMGAGTTNSNLKNNASDVRIWTPSGQRTAGRKCGVMMGDYSRTAINTSINTGTVIGVSSHVFGSGLTPSYIPGFSWGSDGLTRYRFDKALEDIAGWKQLKGQTLSPEEVRMLTVLYEQV